MNKSELITKIAKETNSTDVIAKKHLNAFLEIVTSALNEGEPVNLFGFGSFTAKEYKEKTGRNPQTGASITIPARIKAKCKMSPSVIK